MTMGTVSAVPSGLAPANNQAPTLKRWAIIDHPLRDDEVHILDKQAICGISLNSSEQPKLAFLPEGQRGGPKFLESHIRGGGERPRVTVAKVTSRTEPDS